MNNKILRLKKYKNKDYKNFSIHQYIIWDINSICGFLGFLMFNSKKDFLEYIKNNPIKKNQQVSIQRGMTDDFNESTMNPYYYWTCFCKVRTIIKNKLYDTMQHNPHTWAGFDYITAHNNNFIKKYKDKKYYIERI